MPHTVRPLLGTWRVLALARYLPHMSDRERDYREPLSDEEAEQMDRGPRRLLHTPPKPHGKNLPGRPRLS
jgi:hypothetical protein